MANGSILGKTFKAGDASVGQRVKMLVYGFSGVGKTRFGAISGARTLVALLEPNGLATIREANQDASVVPIYTFDDLIGLHTELNEQLRAGTCAYDCLVLDSGTEAQRRCEDTIIKKALEGEGDSNDPMVNRLGSLTKGGWGYLGKRTVGMLRSFRDLDMDVVVLALAGEHTEGEARYVRPGFSGGITNRDAPGLFNVVGYAFTAAQNVLKREDYVEGDVQYVLMTASGSGQYTTKAHPALATFEDLSEGKKLLDRVRNHWQVGNEGKTEKLSTEPVPASPMPNAPAAAPQPAANVPAPTPAAAKAAKAAPKAIGEKLAATMIPKFDKAKILVQVVLDHYKVESLAHLTVDQMERVISQLDKTIAALAETPDPVDEQPAPETKQQTEAPPAEPSAGVVGPDGAEVLRDILAKLTGLDEAKLLESYKVASLDLIPASHYSAIVRRLTTMGREQGTLS
jgi:hypothetical protein